MVARLATFHNDIPITAAPAALYERGNRFLKDKSLCFSVGIYGAGHVSDSSLKRGCSIL